MTEEKMNSIHSAVKNQEESVRLTERLFEVANPDAVFSKPKKTGDYTIITASEILIGLGSGYGVGGYTPPENKEAMAEGEEVGSGGGGGGGGYSTARPVAVISVGPDGVEIQPVLDRTKFGIALVTAVGSMFIALSRMKRRK